MRVRFRETAKDDLENITMFGVERWGEARAARYADAILIAIGQLGEVPMSGAAVDGLAGLRRRSIESHVIYYRLLDGELIVTRILHQQADAKRHLR